MQVQPASGGASIEVSTHQAVETAAVPFDNAPPQEGAVASPTYSNQMIKVTAETGLAVMVMRDGFSGDVRFQYPAEKVAKEYESHIPAKPVAAAADPATTTAVATKADDAKPDQDKSSTSQDKPQVVAKSSADVTR